MLRRYHCCVYKNPRVPIYLTEVGNINEIEAQLVYFDFIAIYIRIPRPYTAALSLWDKTLLLLSIHNYHSTGLITQT